MMIPIPGTVKLTFPVEVVDTGPVTYDLDDAVTEFPVAFQLRFSNQAGTASGVYRDEIIVTKAQIELDAGKPFANCTSADIRRAIRRTIVAHVKATL